MAKTFFVYDHLAEEDYIDMDISTLSDTNGISPNNNSNNFQCRSTASPPHSKEFEFQMSGNAPERDAGTSPADELFYKGKLLPLYLPPRLQMVDKLLKSSSQKDANEEKTVGTTNSTPLESCNASPTGSCNARGKLVMDENHVEGSAGLEKSNRKRFWSTKLKSMKSSALGLKLRASREYLRSLFSKPNCSQEFNVIPKPKGCSQSCIKVGKKNSLDQVQMKRQLHEDTNVTTLMRSIEREKLMEEEVVQRRSFSGAINWFLASKSSASSSCSSLSSSFSSASSNITHQLQMMQRSNSVNSEIEGSIQGAIAYCKKSQQLISGRKSTSDVEFYSLSAPHLAAACENQEKKYLCRG